MLTEQLQASWNFPNVVSQTKKARVCKLNLLIHLSVTNFMEQWLMTVTLIFVECTKCTLYVGLLSKKNN